MAVDSTHPRYDARIAQWRMMRDASAGEDKVKGAGTEYLPELGGQDSEEYAAYKKRAAFYNATGRTIDGLSGMIFRKAPLVEAPTGMDEFRDDVTLGGISMQSVAEMCIEEVLTVGRCGILVDYPDVESGNITLAQAEAMNLRPFWCLYTAESILYWRVGQIGNKTVLTQVRLNEEVSDPGANEFSEITIRQMRVLDLGEDGASYRQRVFRKGKDGEWYQHGEDIVPLMNNAPLDYIPFVFMGPRDTTPHVCKPPLMDLAYKNMDHYRQDADYHHALHFLAAGMTPYGTGVKREEIDGGLFDATGPTNIWLTTSTDAKFGVVEFNGAGMGAMRHALQDTEQHMAALGARMLAPEKRMAEAAETAAIHRQGEISVLASLAQAVSIALTQALAIARDWSGIGGYVSVRLNSDFLPTPMDPQTLTALMQLWQSGGISFGTMFDNLKRGEIIRVEKTAGEEQAEIETGGSELNNLRSLVRPDSSHG